MTKNVCTQPTVRRRKTAGARSGTRQTHQRLQSPAARLRETALATMHMAIADAFRVTDDIDLITSEIFTNIGCTMNAVGRDPKALGAYLVDQGNALMHPDADQDGPHLSQIAYLATMVGMFPELDALRAQAATEIEERDRPHP